MLQILTYKDILHRIPCNTEKMKMIYQQGDGSINRGTHTTAHFVPYTRLLLPTSFRMLLSVSCASKLLFTHSFCLLLISACTWSQLASYSTSDSFLIIFSISVSTTKGLIPSLPLNVSCQGKEFLIRPVCHLLCEEVWQAAGRSSGGITCPRTQLPCQERICYEETVNRLVPSRLMYRSSAACIDARQ